MGWNAYQYERSRMVAKRWKGLVSPDGKVYGPIKNLAAFCREFGLEPNNVRLVLRGKQESSKGWKWADDFDLMSAVPWEPVEVEEFYMESPVGEFYGPFETGKSFWAFCKEKKIPRDVCRAFWNGRSSEYNGWEFVSLLKE